MIVDCRLEKTYGDVLSIGDLQSKIGSPYGASRQQMNGASSGTEAPDL
jgi:hypothetical protein